MPKEAHRLTTVKETVPYIMNVQYITFFSPNLKILHFKIIIQKQQQQ